MSDWRVRLVVIGVLCWTVHVRADIAPNSLRAQLSGTNIHLSWTAGSGPYAIYRAQIPAGVVSPANKVGTTTGVSFDDPVSVLSGPIGLTNVAAITASVASAFADGLPSTFAQDHLVNGPCP